MSKSFEFYFDFTSPYTYLANIQIPKIAEAADAEVIYRPIFLGGVMEQSGNRPPAVCANKAKYMLTEIVEMAAEYGVPFKMASKFPILALTALRSALLLENDTRQQQFIDAVFKAYWVEDKDISKDEVIAPIAESCELNFDHLKTEISQEAIKQALKDQTTQAVKRGVFGAPTVFLDGKMYFGNESLARLAKALGLSGWPQ